MYVCMHACIYFSVCVRYTQQRSQNDMCLRLKIVAIPLELMLNHHLSQIAIWGCLHIKTNARIDPYASFFTCYGYYKCVCFGPAWKPAIHFQPNSILLLLLDCQHTSGLDKQTSQVKTKKNFQTYARPMTPNLQCKQK